MTSIKNTGFLPQPLLRPMPELLLRMSHLRSIAAFHRASGLSSGTHPQRRRIVRDGEVPVTVAHRAGDGDGTNKLDAARQALREQIAAREHAEQLVQEARATIQDLQTKLAHDRLAREEAVCQAAAERQVIQDELAGERTARLEVERKLDQAVAAGQEAEERLRAMVAEQKAQMPSAVPPTLNPARNSRTPRRTVRLIHAVNVTTGGDGDNHAADNRTPVTVSPDAAPTVHLRRRRGRPPKVRQPEEPGFVKWWKPGWREKLR
jgi:hypothetical protein